MATVSVIGVYPVDTQSCFLVEIEIKNCEGLFNLAQITQAIDGQPEENWQSPYAEQLISSDGVTILSAAFEADRVPDLWIGDIRLGFYFHFMDFGLPLKTPFGDVTLPAPSPMPDRLSSFEVYEEP